VSGTLRNYVSDRPSDLGNFMSADMMRSRRQNTSRALPPVEFCDRPGYAAAVRCFATSGRRHRSGRPGCQDSRTGTRHATTDRGPPRWGRASRPRLDPWTVGLRPSPTAHAVPPCDRGTRGDAPRAPPGQHEARQRRGVPPASFRFGGAARGLVQRQAAHRHALAGGAQGQPSGPPQKNASTSSDRNVRVRPERGS
jgi:hypothetical protein